MLDSRLLKTKARDLWKTVTLRGGSQHARIQGFTRMKKRKKRFSARKQSQNRIVLIRFEISEDALKRADPRLRNQIVGCMHAHNELALLNRVLMFSMNSTAGPGDLNDAAMTVQVWFFLQLLAGKLVETWNMVSERFLQSNPPDAVLQKLNVNQQDSLKWLTAYFEPKDSALKIIRDRTAFHYDNINLAEAIGNLPEPERMIYVARHPANALYFPGSALVFRAAFALIADKTNSVVGRSPQERVEDGVKTGLDEANAANLHMHSLLHGLIRAQLDDLLGHSLDDLTQTRIPVICAPKPTMVGLPTFIDIGKHD